MPELPSPFCKVSVMKLSQILQRLRLLCPSFGQRVAVEVAFVPPAEAGVLPIPAAWIHPLDARPLPVVERNHYRQEVRERFAVVVAVDNAEGEAALAAVHDLRAEIWKALLGWVPTAGHGWIEFEGGQVLHKDGARLYYRFDFGVSLLIGHADTAQAVEEAALPPLAEIDVTVDAWDPADPNTGGPGPDGRPEARVPITLPTT